MLVSALILSALLLQDPAAAPGHWPQWRGPNRDNLSRETGLLKEWPEGGPTLLWSNTELGEAMPPVTVAGGRIYGVGYRDKVEYVTSLDANGKVVWSVPIGPGGGESQQMRFLSQRSVAIDNDRVYAFTVGGTVFCLKALDGGIVWSRKYTELGLTGMTFFNSDTPMVDGPNLICKPGSVACLDKLTGKTRWQSAGSLGQVVHAPLIVEKIGGRRQYLVLSMDRVAGIDAEDGKLLWKAECPGKTAIASTPVYHDGILFVSQGFGLGCHAFRITVEDGRFKASLIYEGRQLQSHRGGFLVVGDCLYGTDDMGALHCLRLETGEVLWKERCVGKGSLVYADGHLIVLGETGTLALVEADPSGYHEEGRFALPNPHREIILHPVLAGGRLYLRNLQTLYCYDVRGPEYKEPPVVWSNPPNAAPPPKKPPVPPGPKTDAAFVPTPHDVVKRMLDLARVEKHDVVYDLGSGDGRILLTAARDYGSKAVGFETDPELVKQSRLAASKANLESLVKVEEKDLFTTDLSNATVVTLYLGAENNSRLLPQLRKLPPKCRIVSHQHRLGEAGPEPDERIIVISNEDRDPHTVYLWITPLKEDQ